MASPKKAIERKQYTDEEKKAVVARCVPVGKESIKDVAKELKINESMLYSWRAKINGNQRPHKKSVSAAPQSVTRETVILLRQSRDSAEEALREGRIKHFSYDQLLSQMALLEVTGEAN